MGTLVVMECDPFSEKEHLFRHFYCLVKIVVALLTNFVVSSIQPK